MKSKLPTQRGLDLAFCRHANVVNQRLRKAIVFIALTMTFVWAGGARADLAIETETARVVKPGHFEIGTAFEFQTSPGGQEYAVPMAFEFGVIPRLEAMIEPVPFTSIQPKSGTPANGLGDTEVTLTYLVFDERRYVPAIAGAVEVKIPTARNRLIGSREFDYRLYGIASKRIGDVDLHLNVGYNVVGEPQGVKTNNPFDVAFAAEWFINDRFDLFAEATYVASSLQKSAVGENPGAARPSARAKNGSAITSELAGEEIVGSVGLRYHFTEQVEMFGSFSYDNLDDKLFRTGVTFKF